MYARDQIPKFQDKPKDFFAYFNWLSHLRKERDLEILICKEM